MTELLWGICLYLSSPTILATMLSKFIVWSANIMGAAMLQSVVDNSIGGVIVVRVSSTLLFVYVEAGLLELFCLSVLDVSEFFDVG